MCQARDVKIDIIFPILHSDWASQVLKEMLDHITSVKALDFSKFFNVTPLVGPNAIGSILLQQGENSRHMRCVCCASKVKNEAGKGYVYNRLNYLRVAIITIILSR